MRASSVVTFALLLPCLAGCDGKYVTYTATFDVDQVVAIRHTGAFSEVKGVDVQTFAEILDDIPPNAEIEKATITALGVDLDILSTTTASSVDLALVASDDGQPVEALSLTQSVNIAAAKLALFLLADSKKQQKINNIKNRINQMLVTRDPWDSLVLGLNGTVHGGRLDADARVIMKATVTYKVCENIGSELFASEASECVSGPLD